MADRPALGGWWGRSTSSIAREWTGLLRVAVFTAILTDTKAVLVECRVRTVKCRDLQDSVSNWQGFGNDSLEFAL